MPIRFKTCGQTESWFDHVAYLYRFIRVLFRAFARCKTGYKVSSIDSFLDASYSPLHKQIEFLGTCSNRSWVVIWVVALGGPVLVCIVLLSLESFHIDPLGSSSTEWRCSEIHAQTDKHRLVLKLGESTGEWIKDTTRFDAGVRFFWSFFLWRFRF